MKVMLALANPLVPKRYCCQQVRIPNTQQFALSSVS